MELAVIDMARRLGKFPLVLWGHHEDLTEAGPRSIICEMESTVIA
jgi:hypothetical protein